MPPGRPPHCTALRAQQSISSRTSLCGAWFGVFYLDSWPVWHRIHNSEGLIPFHLDYIAPAVISSRPALSWPTCGQKGFSPHVPSTWAFSAATCTPQVHSQRTRKFRWEFRMAAQASPHSARWSTSSRTPGWELPSPKLSHPAKQFWRSGWRACELSSPDPVGGTSDASKTQSGLNVNHFRPRCMKARPDTLISPYYSRRCLALSFAKTPAD